MNSLPIVDYPPMNPEEPYQDWLEVEFVYRLVLTASIISARCSEDQKRTLIRDQSQNMWRRVVGRASLNQSGIEYQQSWSRRVKLPSTT